MIILFDDLQGSFDEAYGLFDNSGIQDSTTLLTGIELEALYSEISTKISEIVTGIQVDSYLGDIYLSGSANKTLSGIDLTTSLTEITGSSDELFIQNGLDITAEFSNISANGQAKVVISGISIVSSTGSISSIGLIAQEEGGSYNKKRRKFKKSIPLIEVKDVKIPLSGLDIYNNLAKISALGVIKIGAKAIINGIDSVVEISDIDSSGIQNLQDEEWLILMVA